MIEMKFLRGKISDRIVGPRWCVEHYLDRDLPPANGWFDIVGGADEDEGRSRLWDAARLCQRQAARLSMDPIELARQNKEVAARLRSMCSSVADPRLQQRLLEAAREFDLDAEVSAACARRESVD